MRWRQRWRYVYARPLCSREDAERFKQIIDTHGVESRAAMNQWNRMFEWVPWWRVRRTGVEGTG